MVDSKNSEGVENRKYRTHYGSEFKQRLVAASSKPGSSLSKLAREQGVSVSTLCKWRKHYQQRSEPTILLPIAVEPAIQAPHLSSNLPANASPSPEVPPASSGMIEITLQQASIRINGLIEAATLRVVLESLQRC